MKVEQLMTRDVATVAAATSLKDVARLLTERGISGVPVCDDEGRVLGVVSEADILRKEEGLAPEPGGFLGRLLERADGAEARLQARTAGDAMTSPALTVTPSTSVHEAARLITARKVNRLPVVEDGRLVGILTRADLVRAFQRGDEEIRQEIEHDVLLRTLWISPREVAVTVLDGIVDLSGTVDNRTEAGLLVSYVRRVPGVVDVRSELDWRIDDRARRVAHAPVPRHIRL